MRKQFSNKEILLYAEQLKKIFLELGQDIELPIKINFFLQKNIKTLMDAAQEIEEMRLKIGKKYGTYDSTTQSYHIPSGENLNKAQQEINNLLSIDQILDINLISLTELQNTTHLTVGQMSAMLFMIDNDLIEYIDEEEEVLL